MLNATMYLSNRFSKMIKALRKRFDTEDDSKRPLLTPSDGIQPNYANTNPLDGAA